MKFLAITLVVHAPDPVTREQKSTTSAPVLRREIPDPPWPGETVADPALAELST